MIDVPDHAAVTIGEEIQCLLAAGWTWDGDRLVHPVHEDVWTRYERPFLTGAGWSTSTPRSPRRCDGPGSRDGRRKTAVNEHGAGRDVARWQAGRWRCSSLPTGRAGRWRGPLRPGRTGAMIGVRPRPNNGVSGNRPLVAGQGTSDQASDSSSRSISRAPCRTRTISMPSSTGR